MRNYKKLQMKKEYDEKRPTIPAEKRREVEVEAGHKCSIKDCNEHTYLEIHHIDFNRENNEISNLILVCDKHHKMAHNGVIDRKSLREYKSILRQNKDLLEKITNIDSEITQLKNPKEGIWDRNVTFEISTKNGEFTYQDFNLINYFSANKFFIYNVIIEEIEAGLFKVGLDTKTRKETFDLIELLQNKREYKLYNVKFKE